MSDIECPYCDASLEVCHDDGFGYAEDEAHEMECGQCGKNFVFYTYISFAYAPHQADCLNGAPHNFRDWFPYSERDGILYESKTCRDCGHCEKRTRPVIAVSPPPSSSSVKSVVEDFPGGAGVSSGALPVADDSVSAGDGTKSRKSNDSGVCLLPGSGAAGGDSSPAGECGVISDQ